MSYFKSTASEWKDEMGAASTTTTTSVKIEKLSRSTHHIRKHQRSHPSPQRQGKQHQRSTHGDTNHRLQFYWNSRMSGSISGPMAKPKRAQFVYVSANKDNNMIRDKGCRFLSTTPTPNLTRLIICTKPII